MSPLGLWWRPAVAIGTTLALASLSWSELDLLRTALSLRSLRIVTTTTLLHSALSLSSLLLRLRRPTRLDRYRHSHYRWRRPVSPVLHVWPRIHHHRPSLVIQDERLLPALMLLLHGHRHALLRVDLLVLRARELSVLRLHLVGLHHHDLRITELIHHNHLLHWDLLDGLVARLRRSVTTAPGRTRSAAPSRTAAAAAAPPLTVTAPVTPRLTPPARCRPPRVPSCSSPRRSFTARR